MKKIEWTGTAFVLTALLLLFVLLNTQTYRLTPGVVSSVITDSNQLAYLTPGLTQMEKKDFDSKIGFATAFNKAVKAANQKIEAGTTSSDEKDIGDKPEEKKDDKKINDKKENAGKDSSDESDDGNNEEAADSSKQNNPGGIDKETDNGDEGGDSVSPIGEDFTSRLLVASAKGPVNTYTLPLFILVMALFTFGSLLVTYGKYANKPAGIKNDNVFKKPMTNKKLPAILVGIGLIVFYVILYWYPYLLADWIRLVTPAQNIFSQGLASEDYLYGFIYTVAVILLGIKMFVKYRHSTYQKIRTISVTFFQLCFAFIIPEILAALKQPSVDLKNIWPLDYTFFFGSNISELISSGKFGMYVLVWGIILIIVVVPVLTYFFGKRWYCSWVCGCGGLAETAGDPYRHLSNKKLSAWKIERILIYAVLVITVGMTAVTLINYFSNGNLLGSFTETFQTWYGFAIGSVFAGVIGTGFYPVMGSRVWCRFGCPLSAIFGIIQRYKSRFRITTNGGQCISCGNCSTYCEMGIDVRWYAQRQQNIVRASCVGCGICAQVCPRGVLKLENGTTENRINNNPIIIGNDGIKIAGN